LQTEQTQSGKERFAQTVMQSIREEVTKGKNGKERGDRFLEWAITRLFDASPDEVRNQITDGSNDMGIDAWIKPAIEVDNGGIIQLFQSKFNQSHDESEILQFKADVENFLDMDIRDIKRDDMKLLNKMIKEEKLDYELFYITDQKVQIKRKPSKLTVYGIDQIVDHLWQEIVGIPEDSIEEIPLKEMLPYKNTVIGVMGLSELRKFIEKTQSYIFESNIRKYLQRTRINKNLKETLDNMPNKVFYYNNGITIVGKKIEVIDSKKIKVSQPQIVNGAQTSTTIFQNIGLLDPIQGDIQVTIIQEDSIADRQNITKFRNSQNAVKGKDLISLESFHMEIRAQLDSFGYYYEQQAGAWNYLKPEKKGSYKGHDIYKKYLPDNHDNVIQAPLAIQAMVAGIKQNPTKPYSSIASCMPNGVLYPKTFDSKIAHDYRLLLYPYLVKCYGEILGFGDPEAKPEQKRYARLLFVTAYFKILLDYILKKDSEEIRQNPEPLEKVFKNFELNKKLLEITNDAMTYYLIRANEYYEQHEEVLSWHNFFSKHAWNDELQKSFKSYLKGRDDELKSIRAKLKTN
jgi:hypothetical protein